VKKLKGDTMSNLTKTFVRTAKCPEGKAKKEFYDDTLKGFMLEVKANNRKTFYLRTMDKDKKSKYTKLGDASILPVSDARTKALKFKRSLEEGKDVIIDTPPPDNSSITFGEFYENYYLPHIKTHIKSYETNISIYKNHILPLLANRTMSSVKKSEVMQYHANMVYEKGLAPATANKLLLFLNNAYNIAHTYDLLDTSINPCRGVKEYELNNQRQIFLRKAQTKKLLREVNNSPNEHLKYIIPFLLLTGARKREVLDAQWNQFDFNQMFWTIPITKNGKKRILPITQPLEELLNQIPKQSKYLFPSPKTKKPYVSIFCSWNSARNKAGLPEVRIHDLRHTYASALVNAKCSLYEVQMLLGHSTAKMTQRYAHLSNETLMKAASYAGKLVE
jgi:integrase